MRVIKQSNLFYRIGGGLRYLLPKKSLKREKLRLTKKMSPQQLSNIEKRVNYYCKYNPAKEKTVKKHIVKDLKKPVQPKTYYFDLYEYARFFNENTPLDFIFGDVTEVPKRASIVKSRPVFENNDNSILINLDKKKHFVWVENDKDFLAKQNKLISRLAIYQEHRYQFYNLYFNHPLCDLGHINKRGALPSWRKPNMPIKDQLDYKFILSLEGYDVATNLKWIMSSNSIAVMPKPEYETWFMEGTLKGNVHYIEIKEDYSDLEQQLNYYIQHPEKCLKIIENAHKHCEQFYNKDVEDLTSIKVLEKYFG